MLTISGLERFFFLNFNDMRCLTILEIIRSKYNHDSHNSNVYVFRIQKL